MKNNKKPYYSVGDKIGIYIIKEIKEQIKLSHKHQNCYTFTYSTECENCGSKKILTQKYLRNKELNKPPLFCKNCHQGNKHKRKQEKIETIPKEDKELFNLAIFGDRRCICQNSDRK